MTQKYQIISLTLNKILEIIRFLSIKLLAFYRKIILSEARYIGRWAHTKAKVDDNRISLIQIDRKKERISIRDKQILWIEIFWKIFFINKRLNGLIYFELRILKFFDVAPMSIKKW